MTMCIQLIFAIVGSSILTSETLTHGEDYPYIFPNQSYEQENPWVLFCFNVGVWFIALMNFVPISLLVTIESINVTQGIFIGWDIDIYDEARDLPTYVQSSNLNEELGMVNYIFSDKTGTLTQNIMEFQKVAIGSKKYGVDAPEGVQYAPGVTNVNFRDDELAKVLSDESHPEYARAYQFLEALCLCHTVITDLKKTPEGEEYTLYNASSPDELALVNGARHLGFSFNSRDADGNMVCKMPDGEKVYKLLNVIEFDSARKRMSVVVQTPDERILVLCKGADSIIEKRLNPGQANLEVTQKYLSEFAVTGLRTLLIASKELSHEEYQAWSFKYVKAATSLADKEKQINAVAEKLEVGFDLLGATAIEDKL